MSMDNTLKIMVSAIALASTSACVPEAGNFTGVATPKRNEVQMVRLTHTVNFGSGQELSDNELNALDVFLSQYAVGYGDVLSLDDGDKIHAEWREALQGRLIKWSLVLDSRAVVAGPMPDFGTAVLVVDRYVVSTPACNDFSQQMAPNYENANSPNFGCSSQALLGLMAANPRDLIQGRADSGPNAEAATTALRVYRQQVGRTNNSRGGGNSGSGVGGSASGQQ